MLVPVPAAAGPAAAADAAGAAGAAAWVLCYCQMLATNYYPDTTKPYHYTKEVDTHG